jgi:hypothetical protein
MFLKPLLILFILVFSACQSGRIPCPVVKADKVKKSTIRKKLRYAERNTTASIEELPGKSTRIETYIRPEVRPALEHVDVEEWDCPKPGTKRSLPKALKDNIRKNKRAYETYYKNKSDSASFVKQTTLE